MSKLTYDAVQNMRCRNRQKLLMKATVLRTMEDGGCGDDTIAQLRDLYRQELGFDPIWRQHVGDDGHNGAIIIPVVEGYLYIPYDEVYEDIWEDYKLEEAKLLTVESAQYLLDLTRDYMRPYEAVLQYIVEELGKGKE